MDVGPSGEKFNSRDLDEEHVNELVTEMRRTGVLQQSNPIAVIELTKPPPKQLQGHEIANTQKYPALVVINGQHRVAAAKILKHPKWLANVYNLERLKTDWPKSDVTFALMTLATNVKMKGSRPNSIFESYNFLRRFPKELKNVPKNKSANFINNLLGLVEPTDARLTQWTQPFGFPEKSKLFEFNFDEDNPQHTKMRTEWKGMLKSL